MVWTLLLLACSSTVPQTPEPALVEVRGETMGTTWMVKIAGEADAATVQAGSQNVLDIVNQRMSTWLEDSEIARVRQGPGPVPVSDETAMVVRSSLVIARKTGGAFDPTVQPLVEVWGLHGNPRSAPPTDQELRDALGQVGWNKVTVRGPRGASTIDAGGTALDLSAIAKGHAVDRVSDWLSAEGHPDHLVEVGGEVRARGSKHGAPWALGIDVPEEGSAPGSQFAAIATLEDQAMATSGNYRNHYQAGEVKVVHTLNPRTGRPAIGRVASASVVAPTCLEADGWATSLMVLGEPGLSHIRKDKDLEALLILSTDEGFTQVKTEGFPAE